MCFFGVAFGSLLMLLLNEVFAESGGVLVADLLKNERIDVCLDMVRSDELQVNYSEILWSSAIRILINKFGEN